MESLMCDKCRHRPAVGHAVGIAPPWAVGGWMLEEVSVSCEECGKSEPGFTLFEEKRGKHPTRHGGDS